MKGNKTVFIKEFPDRQIVVEPNWSHSFIYFIVPITKGHTNKQLASLANSCITH